MLSAAELVDAQSVCRHGAYILRRKILTWLEHLHLKITPTYSQGRVATWINGIWEHNRILRKRRSAFRTCNLANTSACYCFPISQKRGLVHSFFPRFKKNVTTSWPWVIGIFLTENELESSLVASLLPADWLTVRTFAFHFVHITSTCVTVLHNKRPPPNHSTPHLG